MTASAFLVREFGPLKLQWLRDEVVARGWSRLYANANVNRVWQFFKGSWRGKGRVILVGPKAQALLAEFPTATPGEYLFSPRRAAAELSTARAAARATPLYPSHVKANARKRKSTPKRRPGERYTRESYARAIHYGVRKANAARASAGLVLVPPWSPLQLRKAAATRFRAEFGLEAAQVLLGHAHASVTEIYAERDLSKCDAAALLVG